MAEERKSVIGRLIDVHENRMIALLTCGENGVFPIVNFNGKKIPVGQIGSFMVIRQLDIRIVAMVIRAYTEEQGLHLAPDGGIKGSNFRAVDRGLVELIPLGELDQKNDFQRGVINFPVPGASVHFLLPDEVDILFKRFRHFGYEPGYLPTMTNKGVCLDPSRLFGRHLAILGQSGSGKSWGVATIIQRAVATMPNAHIILLDLHGEYVWYDEKGGIHSAFAAENMNYFDACDLEIPYWQLTYAELIDLLIDPDDPKASTQKVFLRDVLLDLRQKSNDDFGGVQLSIDSPVYFSMDDLYQQFKNANEQTGDFGRSKGALHGQFDEFLVKLQSRFNDNRYDFLFKPKKRKDSKALAGLLRDFVGLGEKRCQITVIDFSSVPFDVRPMVSAQVGRLAFEFNYWNPHSNEFPILLVCEEAHSYIPREKGTQYDGARRSMERIAKEGRKYGVGLVVVSQRPAEVSETVLAQCGNYICYRVTNPSDQAYIQALVPDAEGDLVKILSALGRGEVLAMGEAIPVPTRLKMYKPDPEPNSHNVDYYHQWRNGKRDLDVEEIVDRWRRQKH